MFQVGACIVNKNNRIVSTGYNGMPDRCHDDKMAWGRDKTGEDNKHLYVCHAEMNAIVNKNSSSLKDCILYVSLFPCNECAKIIIQSRIAEVVYYSDKYSGRPETIAAKFMFDEADVKYRTPVIEALFPSRFGKEGYVRCHCFAYHFVPEKAYLKHVRAWIALFEHG